MEPECESKWKGGSTADVMVRASRKANSALCQGASAVTSVVRSPDILGNGSPGSPVVVIVKRLEYDHQYSEICTRVLNTIKSQQQTPVMSVHLEKGSSVCVCGVECEVCAFVCRNEPELSKHGGDCCSPRHQIVSTSTGQLQPSVPTE